MYVGSVQRFIPARMKFFLKPYYRNSSASACMFFFGRPFVATTHALTAPCAQSLTLPRCFRKHRRNEWNNGWWRWKSCRPQ